MNGPQPVPTHAEFVAAYRGGRARVSVDRAGAARFVSARTLLPLVLLPLLGGAAAVALLGHYILGAALFVLALALRLAVRASGQGFVRARAPGCRVLPRGVRGRHSARRAGRRAALILRAALGWRATPAR